MICEPCREPHKPGDCIDAIAGRGTRGDAENVSNKAQGRGTSPRRLTGRHFIPVQLAAGVISTNVVGASAGNGKD